MEEFNQWAGMPIVCIATGPSLKQWQIDIVEAAHSQNKCKVITVNNAWELCPWGDAHYAGDRRWWERYLPEMGDTKGQKWCGCPGGAKQFNLNYIKRKQMLLLPLEPGLISHGCNSGHQALSLAFQFGGNPIILLGYDCQYEGAKPKGKRHYFGSHPAGWGDANNAKKGSGVCEGWKLNFQSLEDCFVEQGIEVINCSIDTALTFKRACISEVL